jgi:hypothetical protein
MLAFRLHQVVINATVFALSVIVSEISERYRRIA